MRVPGVLALLQAYRTGELRPREVLVAAHRRAAACPQPAWIALLGLDELLARLDGLAPGLPLYGVPFAVKDNIDLAGVPTTAACPEFARTPAVSAFVVRRLLEAGAIPLGKTNMDQFATGLVGTRSPHGACHSVFGAEHVSGGSSSGSAVAVADGHVAFALGTDTAGSGRVPAAFNELVGVKASPGRLSTGGVIPACRSLDCVSVLARDVADAEAVLEQAAGYDPADPWARPHRRGPAPRSRPRVAIPAELDLADPAAGAAWEGALAQGARAGWTLVPADLSPLLEAGRLLYEGPWIAERTADVGDFIARGEATLDPTVAAIIMGGAAPSAVEAFRAIHRLAELRRASEAVWDEHDGVLLPTTPSFPTRAAVAADPVGVNAALGTFTNFVNLLGCAAVAVPGPRRADGLPSGVQLVGDRGTDERLLALARGWEAAGPEIELCVVGAHLSGQPLNGALTGRGARLLARTRTAGHYRLVALAGEPPRPGLVAGEADPPHAGIEAEIWGLGRAALGALVAEVPAPLAIGTVELADGRRVRGFVCEPRGLEGARDITELGGWRAHLERTPEAVGA